MNNEQLRSATASLEPKPNRSSRDLPGTPWNSSTQLNIDLFKSEDKEVYVLSAGNGDPKDLISLSDENQLLDCILTIIRANKKVDACTLDE